MVGKIKLKEWNMEGCPKCEKTTAQKDLYAGEAICCDENRYGKKSLTRKIEMADFICKDCGFELYIPIMKFGVSVLGLYDDDRFPGRCLLVYRKHIEHFEMLEGEDMCDFISDIKLATVAIKRAMGVDRVNICILGNAEPHLHAHLIPRVNENDPVPGKAPWVHPRRSRKMEVTRMNQIVLKIGYCLQAIIKGVDYGG